MSADFLIVGGGIGGGVLAELLGRSGKRVVVLERSTAPPKWLRPEILWPVTARVLFSLIPREKLEEEAILALQGLEINYGQRTRAPITPKLLHEVQVQPWSTNPNQIREQLLRLSSFELRRGVEVIAVLQEQNRVVGVRTRDVATAEEQEVLAHWTVGDDGVQSVVRKACGIEIQTRPLPIDFLCFGFDWPATLPPATARVWLNLKRAASGTLALGALPVPGGKGAGLVAVRTKIFDRSLCVEEAWRRFCSADAAIKDVVGDRHFPRDFVRIRRPWGHAPRYGMEGAILIGDAVHPVSPAGGQGANMAVADACVLAEIALRNGTNLLEEYERRRRPANEHSMGFTRVAALVLGLPEWCFPTSIFFAGVGWMSSHPSLVRRFLRSASAAFQERKN